MTINRGGDGDGYRRSNSGVTNAILEAVFPTLASHHETLPVSLDCGRGDGPNLWPPDIQNRSGALDDRVQGPASPRNGDRQLLEIQRRDRGRPRTSGEILGECPDRCLEHRHGHRETGRTFAGGVI